MKHKQSCWECKGSKGGYESSEEGMVTPVWRHAGLMKLEETREWEMF